MVPLNLQDKTAITYQYSIGHYVMMMETDVERFAWSATMNRKGRYTGSNETGDEKIVTVTSYVTGIRSTAIVTTEESGPWFSIKMSSCRYGKSHWGD